MNLLFGWSRIRLCFIIVFMTCLTACALHSLHEGQEAASSPAEGYKSLDRFPFHEAWYGIYFEDDKIGYSHFKIDSGKEGFMISFDSVIRLRIGSKTKEIDLREKVHVQPDLTLVSFRSTVNMNNKQMEMRGAVHDSRLEVDITIDGEKIKRDYEFAGKLYHSSAVSLIPALRGLRDGQEYSFMTFNAERQGLEKVDQHISRVKGSPGPNGSVWKVNTVCGGSTVHSWLNDKGLTVIDKGGSEPIITFLEDESSARNFLKRKALRWPERQPCMLRVVDHENIIYALCGTYQDVRRHVPS